jgi:hypothetical protein
MSRLRDFTSSPDATERAATVLRRCYDGATTVPRQCNSGCHGDATVPLRKCYSIEARILLQTIAPVNGAQGPPAARLPPSRRVPMLRGCSLYPKRKPTRSAPPSIGVAKYWPPSSCVGCSRASRTTMRRGTAPGPSPDGNRWCRSPHPHAATGVAERDQSNRATGENSADSVGEWTSQWSAMVVLASLGQSPARMRSSAGIGMAGP